MPLSKNGVMKYKRRTPKRRHKKRTYLPLLGVPRSKMVRLKWVENNTIDVAAGGLTAVHYSANDIRQPDGSTAHSCLGYDQWSVFYDHYTVVGSRIRIRAIPVDNNVGGTGVFGCFLDDDNVTTYTTATALIESKQGGNKYATYQGNAVGLGQNPEIRRNFSARKFFGTKSIVGKSVYRGSFTAATSPSEEAYFALWAASPDASNNPLQCTFMVEIEYIAVLTEPKFVAQS